MHYKYREDQFDYILCFGVKSQDFFFTTTSTDLQYILLIKIKGLVFDFFVKKFVTV